MYKLVESESKIDSAAWRSLIAMSARKEGIDGEEFVARGRDVELWILKAKQQLCVVHVVWNRLHQIRDLRLGRPLDEHELCEEVGCFSATLLHMAFALELSAKAVLIARDPSIISESGLSADCFGKKGGHDLMFLVEKAIGRIGEKEKEFLRRLTEATLWTGRYPIPKRVEVMALVEKERLKCLEVPRDKQSLESLLKRLHERARNEGTKTHA